MSTQSELRAGHFGRLSLFMVIMKVMNCKVEPGRVDEKVGEGD